MRTFLLKIYIYSFFDDFVIIYPLYAVMFQDFGIEPWQISFLLSVWSITAFILEVPSGVLADKYSRKNILFVGQLFRALGYIIWLIFPTFIGFLIGFIFWGIQSAFSSGTYQALLYDELKKFGKEKRFAKIFGRSRTISFFAILAGSVLASPAILFGYPVVLILSSFSVVIASTIIAFLPSATNTHSTSERKYFSLFKQGFVNVFKNPAVFKLLFFTSLVFAFACALAEYWSLFADEAGLPNYGLGVFVALIYGAEGISSFIAYRLENLKIYWFYLLFILSGALLLLAGYLFTVPALALIAVFAFLNGITKTIFESKLQHVIPSETRATISSIKGLFLEIKSLMIYFIVGSLAQFSNYRMSFMTIGIIMILIGFLYVIFTKKALVI